jgi:type IV secretory pathway VirB4 component
MFFNEKENIAHRHINSLFKLNGKTENSFIYKEYKRKGWITTDNKILDLIKNGEISFFINTAKRILSEHENEVFLNNCPKCKKLARTPNAKQCRHCGNKWF